MIDLIECVGKIELKQGEDKATGRKIFNALNQDISLYKIRLEDGIFNYYTV